MVAIDDPRASTQDPAILGGRDGVGFGRLAHDGETLVVQTEDVAEALSYLGEGHARGKVVISVKRTYT